MSDYVKQIGAQERAEKCERLLIEEREFYRSEVLRISAHFKEREDRMRRLFHERILRTFPRFKTLKGHTAKDDHKFVIVWRYFYQTLREFEGLEPTFYLEGLPVYEVKDDYFFTNWTNEFMKGNAP